MIRKPTSAPPRRLLFIALFALLIFSLVLRAALTLNRQLDVDEFQHLHSAWMLSRHYHIYRDFWEPHTPLLYYLLLPLFRFFREGPRLVLAARAALSLSALGILLLTYALARLAHDRLTSLLAVVVLSYAFVFVQKSVEIRPDQPLVIAWLASLWVAAGALSKARAPGDGPGPSRLFSAGLLLGVGFLFSPKALLPLGAMGVTFAALALLPPARRTFGDFLKIGCAYVFGFLVPVAACLALFLRAGTLREMIGQTLLENFSFPHNVHPIYLLNLRNVCFLTLALAGIVLRARAFRDGTARGRATHIALLLPNLLLLAIILFVVAYPFPQIVLLVAPALAIYAAHAARHSLDSFLAPRRGRPAPRAKAALLFACVVAAALVIPCVGVFAKERPFTKTNTAQFRTMEYVLSLTSPTDAVFDGEAVYVFRPQAYFYGSLVQGVRWRIGRGEIGDDIPRSLYISGCKVVIFDERVAGLPPPDQLFIRANYEPSAEPGVYLLKRQSRALPRPRVEPCDVRDDTLCAPG